MTTPTNQPPPSNQPPPGGPPSGAMPPAGAAGSRDRTELWGWLGIIIGLCCCGIVGVIFGVLSIQDARRHGKSPVLGWIAIGVSALNIVVNGIAAATNSYPWLNND